MIRLKIGILLLSGILFSLIVYIVRPAPGPYVEANSGPSIDTGNMISGIAVASDGNLLVATRSKGIFLLTKDHKWVPLSLSQKTPELIGVRSFVSDYFVIGQSNIFRLSTSLEVIETFENTGFIDVTQCGSEIVFWGTNGLGIYQDNKVRVLGKSPGGIKSVACDDQEIFVGTEGQGVWKCSDQDCERYFSQPSSQHISALHWNRSESRLLVGLYGDVEHSVMELKSGRFVAVGTRIGDVVGFIPNSGKSLPDVLTETGYIYKISRRESARKHSFSNIITGPLVPYKGKYFAGSFNKIIEISRDQVRDLGGPTFVGEIQNERLVANSFIWDIKATKEGILIVATGQAGVWWSSDWGDTWSHLGSDLADLKIHSIYVDDENNSILAGGHSGGLFECKLPCLKWQRIPIDELVEADVQQILPFGDRLIAVATERGLAILDRKHSNLVGFHQLCDRKGCSADMWTMEAIDDELFIGIYSKPNLPVGVWKFLGNRFDQVADMNEPVTGITKFKSNYIIGTLNGIYSCEKMTCSPISNISVNRFILFENELFIASRNGVFRFDLSKNNSTRLSGQLSQSINLYETPIGRRLFVGTIDRGVMRIKF